MGVYLINSHEFHSLFDTERRYIMIWKVVYEKANLKVEISDNGNDVQIYHKYNKWHLFYSGPRDYLKKLGEAAKALEKYEKRENGNKTDPNTSKS